MSTNDIDALLEVFECTKVGKAATNALDSAHQDSRYIKDKPRKWKHRMIAERVYWKAFEEWQEQGAKSDIDILPEKRMPALYVAWGATLSDSGNTYRVTRFGYDAETREWYRDLSLPARFLTLEAANNRAAEVARRYSEPYSNILLETTVPDPPGACAAGAAGVDHGQAWGVRAAGLGCWQVCRIVRKQGDVWRLDKVLSPRFEPKDSASDHAKRVARAHCEFYTEADLGNIEALPLHLTG